MSARLTLRRQLRQKPSAGSIAGARAQHFCQEHPSGSIHPCMRMGRAGLCQAQGLSGHCPSLGSARVTLISPCAARAVAGWHQRVPLGAAVLVPGSPSSCTLAFPPSPQSLGGCFRGTNTSLCPFLTGSNFSLCSGCGSTLCRWNRVL